MALVVGILFAVHLFGWVVLGWFAPGPVALIAALVGAAVGLHWTDPAGPLRWARIGVAVTLPFATVAAVICGVVAWLPGPGPVPDAHVFAGLAILIPVVNTGGGVVQAVRALRSLPTPLPLDLPAPAARAYTHVRHDARVEVDGERVTVGLALLSRAPEHVGAAIAFARAVGVPRAVRSDTAYRRWRAHFSKAELTTSPWSPLFWAVAVVQATSAAMAAEALREAQDRALANVPGAAAARAAQRQAGADFLRQVWTAIDLARSGPADPTDLYRLTPSPERADATPEPAELARVSGVDRGDVAPTVGPGVLDPELDEAACVYTARVLGESLLAERMHRAALGLGPIPQMPP